MSMYGIYVAVQPPHSIRYLRMYSTFVARLGTVGTVGMYVGRVVLTGGLVCITHYSYISYSYKPHDKHVAERAAARG